MSENVSVSVNRRWLEELQGKLQKLRHSRELGANLELRKEVARIEDEIDKIMYAEEVPSA